MTTPRKTPMTAQRLQVLGKMRVDTWFDIERIAVEIGKNPNNPSDLYSVRGCVTGMWESGLLRRERHGRAYVYALPEPDDMDAPAESSAPEPQTEEVKPVTPMQAVEQLAQAVAESAAVFLRSALKAMVEREIAVVMREAMHSATQLASQAAESAIPPALSNKAVRVAIAGLLNGQAEMIRKEFGNELHLTFLTSEQANGKRMQQIAAQAEHVIVMTDFIKHATEYSIKAAGSNNLVRISGGMTRLRDTLTDIYLGEPVKHCA